MSDLPQVPSYARALDLSPPPSPEAVLGQAGRPAVTPPVTSQVGLRTEPALAVTPPPAERSPLPPGIPVNSRGEPYNLAPAPGERVPASAIGPERMRQMGEAQGASPSSGYPTPEETAEINRRAIERYSRQPLPSQAQPPAQAPAQQPPPGRGDWRESPSPVPPRLTGTRGGEVLDTGPRGQVVKPSIPVAEVNQMAAKKPEMYNTITEIAAMYNVNPHRLIRTMAIESDFRMNARGKDGEEGPYQFMVQTRRDIQRKYFRGREMNPFDLVEGTHLAAALVRELDGRFGADSINSIRAYNGGPKGINNPKTAEYARKFFGSNTIDIAGAEQAAASGSKFQPRGFFEAAREGGPPEALRYIVKNSPRGMGMSDAWQHAQSVMVYGALQMGDLEGAQKAQDFVMQQAFQGTNMFLQEAYNRLSRGDGIGAAQAAAKSHAFVPDGSAFEFHSNGKELYGQRFDEDTGKPLGKPVQIRPEDLMNMMKFTGNPQTWMKQVLDNQKSVADMRYKDAQTSHEWQKPELERDKLAWDREKVGIQQAGENWRHAEGQARQAAQFREQEIRHWQDQKRQWDQQTRTLTGQDKIEAQRRADDTQKHIDNLEAQRKTRDQADLHHVETLKRQAGQYDQTRRDAAAPKPLTPAETSTKAREAFKDEPVPEGKDPDQYNEKRADVFSSILRTNSPGSVDEVRAKALANQLMGGGLKLVDAEHGWHLVDPKTQQTLANVDMDAGERFHRRLHLRSPRQPGLVAVGNIDLGNRPVVKTPDGKIATVRSISVGVDNGLTALIPTISDDGKQLTDQQAKDQFGTTKKHLGIFQSQEAADAYAQKLSTAQGERYGEQTQAPAQALPGVAAPPPTPTGTPENPRQTGMGPVVDRPPPATPGQTPWIVEKGREAWRELGRVPEGGAPRPPIDLNRPR